MISTILTCLLPLAASLDADFSVNVQVAPGISINLHSPSYYDQREKERQARLEQIQADREEERNRLAALERNKPRDQGGVYLWRDTREEREREHLRLMEDQRQHEEARLAQERLLREEEERDREERRLAVEHEREERMREEAIREEDRRHEEEEMDRKEDRRHWKSDAPHRINDEDHRGDRSIQE